MIMVKLMMCPFFLSDTNYVSLSSLHQTMFPFPRYNHPLHVILPFFIIFVGSLFILHDHVLGEIFSLPCYGQHQVQSFLLSLFSFFPLLINFPRGSFIPSYLECCDNSPLKNKQKTWIQYPSNQNVQLYLECPPLPKNVLLLKIVLQDEKNQLLISNVWLNFVSKHNKEI